ASSRRVRLRDDAALTCLVYCYGALRHLHSFPTRRSSDLVVRVARPPSDGDLLGIHRVAHDEVGGRDLGRPAREKAHREVERTPRSEEHTSELQSPYDLVCRLLLEKKKSQEKNTIRHSPSD